MRESILSHYVMLCHVLTCHFHVVILFSSLNPGVDRLAYSCIWRMSADGHVISSHPVWYGRTVIRSCAKLDYQTVALPAVSCHCECGVTLSYVMSFHVVMSCCVK